MTEKALFYNNLIERGKRSWEENIQPPSLEQDNISSCIVDIMYNSKNDYSDMFLYSNKNIINSINEMEERNIKIIGNGFIEFFNRMTTEFDFFKKEKEKNILIKSDVKHNEEVLAIDSNFKIKNNLKEEIKQEEIKQEEIPNVFNFKIKNNLQEIENEQIQNNKKEDEEIKLENENNTKKQNIFDFSSFI